MKDLNLDENNLSGGENRAASIANIVNKLRSIPGVPETPIPPTDSQDLLILGNDNGKIEIKSSQKGDGSVIAETLTFDTTTFIDTIVAGTYEGVQPTGGNGTGLTVTVNVSGGDLKSSPTSITGVTVTDGGTGYQAGDVISIATSELGADTSTETTSYTLTAEDLDAGKEQSITMKSSREEETQSITITPTSISMTNLITSDPGVAGQLWVSPLDGTLKLSQGGTPIEEPPLQPEVNHIDTDGIYNLTISPTGMTSINRMAMTVNSLISNFLTLESYVISEEVTLSNIQLNPSPVSLIDSPSFDFSASINDGSPSILRSGVSFNESNAWVANKVSINDVLYDISIQYTVYLNERP